MSLPTIEIVRGAPTDAYRANQSDPEVVKPAADLITQTDGQIALYNGLQVEEPNHVYIYNIWKDIDAHSKLTADKPKHQELLQHLSKIFATKDIEVFHVHPRSDPLPALNAPITELASAVLKDPATREEVEQAFVRVIQAQENVKGIYGATWGQVVEKEDTYVLIVGWESVEAHTKARETFTPDLVAFRDTIRKLTTIAGATHTALKLYK